MSTPAVYLLTPVPCRCTADRPCVHGEGPCLSNAECATQGHYYFCGGQDCVDTGELQSGRGGVTEYLVQECTRSMSTRKMLRSTVS